MSKIKTFSLGVVELYVLLLQDKINITYSPIVLHLFLH